MKTKWKLTIAVTTLAVFVGACLLLISRRKHNAPVRLTFQRYSTFIDPYVGDVAFLSLTNVSDKSYLLSMTGNSNSLVLDTFFGHFKQSWMVNCEFHDETPTGWTNWIQQPSPSRGSNSYLSLQPHSGIVIRVPLSPDGRHRRVAVLYESPFSTPVFWATPVGLFVLRLLPSQLRNRVIRPKPILQRAWCDRELSYPTNRDNR